MNIVHGRNRPWLFVNIHQNKHNSESTGVVPSGAYSNPPIGSKKLKIFIDNNKIFQEYIAQIKRKSEWTTVETLTREGRFNEFDISYASPAIWDERIEVGAGCYNEVSENICIRIIYVIPRKIIVKTFVYKTVLLLTVCIPCMIQPSTCF